jgi:peptidoglycan/LPS O-acetylase OafA/YrhL
MNKKNSLHVPSLDGVRAIAALMVMFFHFFQNFYATNSVTAFLKTISAFGQTGVSLFFVLSGFLITRILIREKNSEHFFLNFYFRRSLRIFPLYYFYLILVFFIIPIINHTDVPEFSKQIYHWVYFQDFAITFKWDYMGPLHFWSLAVEEHFYLFFPLLVYYLKQNQLVYAIFAILISSIVVRYFLNRSGYEVFYFTFSRMDELALGAILAVLELKNKLTQQMAYRFLYLFIAIALPTLCLWYVFSKDANASLQVVKYVLLSLCYFCMLGFIISAADTNFIKRALIGKPLVYIGKISYGLYVYHGLCFYYFKELYDGNNSWILFFGSFLLAIGVSSFSFYVFESQFFRFKDYFKQKNATHTIQ